MNIGEPELRKGIRYKLREIRSEQERKEAAADWRMREIMIEAGTIKTNGKDDTPWPTDADHSREAGDGTAPEEAEGESAWRLIDDVELLQMPEPQWSVKNVICQGGFDVFFGPPEAGKTTLVTALAGSLATGKKFFAFEVLDPGPVVYVAGEDTSGFRSRLVAWKEANGFPLDQVIGVYVLPVAVSLLNPKDVQLFLKLVRPRKPRHLIIDTYATSMPGGNENTSEDTTRMVAAANLLRQELASDVNFVHHSTKEGFRERGHSALRGAADTMIAVTKDDDLITIECDKQRNGSRFDPWYLKLVVRGQSVVLHPASEVLSSGELTQQQRKVLAALKESFVGGATKAEWQRASAVPERTFFRASAHLIRNGFVEHRKNRCLVTPKGEKA